MNKISTAQGDFTLNRFPIRKSESLRAWDAADEYILAHLCEEVSNGTRVLIINDNFGALTVALSTFNPTVQTDSYLSHQGILENLAANNIDSGNITLLNSMESLEGIFDIVIIKAPRSNTYLEDILCNIQLHITPKTKILSAAMAKNIHTNTLKIFEKIIGETTTSLAKKKARLIFSTFTNKKIAEGPAPKCFVLDIGESELDICNLSNVFSREKLDIGTRFMLENMPHSDLNKTIIDLGCGNGILGIVTAQQHPDAKIIFTDESYMAVASAKKNFEAAFNGTREAEFFTSDCLEGIEPDSIDLIICNPPFHQNTVEGDHVAWQMFNEAHEALKHGGEFWIVGNHHLAYHAKLKTIFGGYKVVASNKKFAIMFSRKS